MKTKYATTASDGHDEVWEYYDSEHQAILAFEYMQSYEDDIHLYELNADGEYEVIDSWWSGDDE